MLELIFNGERDIFVWISFFLSVVAVVFISTPVHEFAHAKMAVKLGDPTPKYTGRTSLNPFAHIDPIGALLILLFRFGWAKPVQVNPGYFKNPKVGMAITAAAGPISNIILGFVFYLITKIFLAFLPFEIQLNSWIYYLYIFLMFIVEINVSLAVFNLIPVPPLDGSRLLFCFLSDRAYFMVMQYERYISYAIIFLLFTNVLDYPLATMQNFIIRLYELLTFWL